MQGRGTDEHETKAIVCWNSGGDFAAALLVWLFEPHGMTSGGTISQIHVIRVEQGTRAELSLDADALERLAGVLDGLKIRRSLTGFTPYASEGVLWEINLVDGDGPWHIVLGDPQFAYRSAGFLSEYAISLADDLITMLYAIPQ